jgi:hypothetical protein
MFELTPWTMVWRTHVDILWSSRGLDHVISSWESTYLNPLLLIDVFGHWESPMHGHVAGESIINWLTYLAIVIAQPSISHRWARGGHWMRDLLRYILLVLWTSSILVHLHGKKIMTEIWVHLLPSKCNYATLRICYRDATSRACRWHDLSHHYFLVH